MAPLHHEPEEGRTEKRSTVGLKPAGCPCEAVTMPHRLLLVPFLVFCVAVSGAREPCDDVPWHRLEEAMIRGDEGVMATLIGSGRLSLRLDNIPQGRYTAQQAKQLLGDFFSRTAARFISCGLCNSSGNRLWAEATYRYRERDTKKTVEERLLLEWCVDGRSVQLSGIRSVSISSEDVIPRPDGTSWRLAALLIG